MRVACDARGLLPGDRRAPVAMGTEPDLPDAQLCGPEDARLFLNRDYPPVENLNQDLKARARSRGDGRGCAPRRSWAKRTSTRRWEKTGDSRRRAGQLWRLGHQRRTGLEEDLTIQAQYRAEQFAKVLRYTTSTECRMAGLVRHFGDVADAPGPAESAMHAIRPELSCASSAGRHRRSGRWCSRLWTTCVPSITGRLARCSAKSRPGWRISRNDFEGLLDAMVRAGLIEIEEAEFEKDGESIRFRKVRLTTNGLDVRPTTPLALLVSDGIVEEFAGGTPRRHGRKSQGCEEARGWAGAVDDRGRGPGGAAQGVARGGSQTAARSSLCCAARQDIECGRPSAPLESEAAAGIDGDGPAKVEKFGEAILGLCSSGRA